MLLITRRTGEGVIINGEIEIRILEVRGGRVKLGMDYPQGNTVYRQEVFAKIQAENRAAAGTLPTPGATPEKIGAQIGTVLASLGKGKANKGTDNHATEPATNHNDD